MPLSSWAKLQVPYYVPNHPVLPSVEEIEHTMKEYQYPRPSIFACPPSVCKLGDLIIKKDITGLAVQEAETLLYLRAHSTVRAPELYAVLTSEKASGVTVYYLVIKYIDGFALSADKFLSMSSTTQAKIITSLSNQLCLIRAIPSPGYYGHVYNQGWRPTHRTITSNCSTLCRPYDTYDAFAQAAYNAAELSAAKRYISPDLYEDQVSDLIAFKSVLNCCAGRDPRFTHLDIQMRNMIATPIGGSSEGDAQDWEVTMIDWADAGWFPAWAQAVVLRGKLHLFTQDMKDHEEERFELVDAIWKDLGEQSYANVEKVFWELIGSAGYTVM